MKAAQLFKKVSLIAALLAICVVVLGAYVRLSDAGLGCPDWPGCYGTMTVPQSVEAIAHAEQAFQAKVEVDKAWKEMLHRYFAGTLGLLVLLMCVTGWLGRAYIRTSPWLTTGLLGLVAVQALLGMWTVTLLLKPVIVTAHLMGGMMTLALLVWVAHRHWGKQFVQQTVSAKPVVRFAVLLLLGQIFLGGWTSSNYAALACTDFPTCHGLWVPPLDFNNAFHMVRDLGESVDGSALRLEALETIQWVHRLGALVVLIYFMCMLFLIRHVRKLRIYVWLIAILLVSQIGLGISNLLLHLPLPLAVGHNMFAALLLAATVALNSTLTSQNAR